jgi:hypothetical protein
VLNQGTKFTFAFFKPSVMRACARSRPGVQAGILNNKSLTDRAQKASLYGWFAGSLCTIVLELYELAGANVHFGKLLTVFPS